MGDWHMNRDGKWVYDENAPSANSEATRIQPAAPAPDESIVEAYEHRDGSIYGRVEAAWFEPYDRVDSRTIVDAGGPDAA